jgi:hypothetical protein
LIRAAIAGLDEPVERLAGGLIASARMPALHAKAGVDRGLSALRLQLSQAEPELLAASQEPVTAVFRELVTDALASTSTDHMSADEATYFVVTMRTAFMLSLTLGNDVSVPLPDIVALSRFCLGGIGLPRPTEWHADIDARLELSGGDGRSVLRSLAKGSARAGR